MQDLPYEIYEMIIDKDPDVFWGMLVVKKFTLALDSHKISEYKKRFIVVENGFSYFRNKLHSFFDLPTLIDHRRIAWWYKNGKLHRDNDLPAIEYPDGTKEWWKDGLLHRENDQPAVIWADNTKMWFKYGNRFRENNMPIIEEPKQ